MLKTAQWADRKGCRQECKSTKIPAAFSSTSSRPSEWPLHLRPSGRQHSARRLVPLERPLRRGGLWPLKRLDPSLMAEKYQAASQNDPAVASWGKLEHREVLRFLCIFYRQVERGGDLLNLFVAIFSMEISGNFCAVWLVCCQQMSKNEPWLHLNCSFLPKMSLQKVSWASRIWPLRTQTGFWN